MNMDNNKLGQMFSSAINSNSFQQNQYYHSYKKDDSFNDGYKEYDREKDRDRRDSSGSYIRKPKSFMDSGGGYNSYGDGHQRYAPMNKNSELGSKLRPIEWGKVFLEPFQKNFYQEHPITKARSEEEIDQFKREKEIVVRCHHLVPRPFMTLEEASLPQYLLDMIHKVGFTEPTPIQAQTWPITLNGRNLIGIAQTGSGKTLAYILPAIVHINAQPPVKQGEGPICLILGPTRELVMQIQDQCIRFGTSSKLKSACVYGGVDRREQKNELLKGCDVVIATPGRLIDFLESRTISLRRVTYLVLDEADRMLDMGFEPQIRKILSQIRPDRQTLMWSATWPREVQSLAHDFCPDPTHIQIGSSENTVNEKITQIIKVVTEVQKKNLLLKFLKDNLAGQNKVLVFTQTKKNADSLARNLRYEGWPNEAIHGDKTQKERDSVMDKFKSGKIALLIATDVASRGLDIKDINFVVNYDFPLNIEDYTHRIGRTGRAGNRGIALSFFTSENKKLAKDLIKHLNQANQPIPEELYEIGDIRKGGGGDRHYERGGSGGWGGGFKKDYHRREYNDYGNGGSGGSGGGGWNKGEDKGAFWERNNSAGKSGGYNMSGSQGGGYGGGYPGAGYSSYSSYNSNPSWGAPSGEAGMSMSGFNTPSQTYYGGGGPHDNK